MIQFVWSHNLSSAFAIFKPPTFQVSEELLKLHVSYCWQYFAYSALDILKALIIIAQCAQ
jgi:hypothetical protein